MPSNHKQKVLITGASRGIGRATAELLYNNGWQVVAIARDFSDWTDRSSEIEIIQLDLSQTSQLAEQLKAIAKKHPDIDAVICNAGAGRFGALEQFSYRQIEAMLQLNLQQHLFVSRTFLPPMKRLGGGSLIFVGSESALTGGRYGAIYSACKFGLRGFAQSLREECSSSGIRVGIINPGMVKSHFFDTLDFKPGDDPANSIPVTEVAKAIESMLNAGPHTVIDEINLSPLKKVVQKK
ncbi:MAG: SDR family NAD(P)-dependent oxidoreductase [Candidatus Polarisedimenticolaceae bacterium]|nr:SDR family NAD(P)-dependent oxidoreductase [Candidatus Polarisedimenticolaceae bacterium]